MIKHGKLLASAGVGFREIFCLKDV
jgi:hypothetical protein